MTARFWLMKSEPSEVSIDDVLTSPQRCVEWFGVRNYQARNFMMRDMSVGDGVLFYHSSCAEPGIVGLARVARAAEPDITQFDPSSPYFDPKATSANPRWYCVKVEALLKTPLIQLSTLRQYPVLQGMRVLAKGNRLSITPVTPEEWNALQPLLIPSA
ncbi:MAG: EVE domain-containing protein [Ferrovum sp.]|jgi:predicted RNA-binding protein with PUA-like domain|nr:EVE domain-containing protein [Ferrovum sp.]NDU87191.1 EVE domain-containing protein [Ferrovum sp.]